MSAFSFPKWDLAKFSNSQGICKYNLSGTLSRMWSLSDFIEKKNSPLASLKLGYCPQEGLPSLREKIAYTEYDPPIGMDNIVTTSGSVEGLFCIYHALLSPGDHVICVSPSYEGLWKIPQNMGAKIHFFPLDYINNSWDLNIDGLLELINCRTKMLVINFPNNPTGLILNRKKLDLIIKKLSKHGVYLISDEVFRGLSHDSVISEAVANLYPLGISLSSASKFLSLPGLRIAWIATQKKTLLKRILEIKRYLSVCNDLLSETILIQALEKKELIIKANLELINRNWQSFAKSLLFYKDYLSAAKPEGGSMCALEVRGPIDTNHLHSFLLKKHSAFIIPLSLMGFSNRFLRIGLGGEDFDIKANILCEAVNQFSKKHN